MLPWDETLDVFDMLTITPVKELYRGPWNEAAIAQVAASIDPKTQEGFVVRDAGMIDYPDDSGDAGRFFHSLAKWVRKGHVQTDKHWSFRWRDEPHYRNELAR